MGIELLFLLTVALWLVLFTYLLIIHVSQRRLAKGAARVYQSLEDVREKKSS